jgi:beta-phosphoglucomutase
MPDAIRLQELDAVIFDMDGVLIDSMPSHARAWITVLQELGVRITPADVYAREGEAGAVSLSHFLSQSGVSPTPEFIRDLLARKEKVFKQTSNLQVFAGVRELLAELRRLGKKLAIVTGTAWDELQVALPSDLKAYFAVFVTGDRVRRGKPDPEPYLTALRDLGVGPQRAVVVENAPLGILSAKAAGLYCLAVATSMHCSELSRADACFQDIPSLAASLIKN